MSWSLPLNEAIVIIREVTKARHHDLVSLLVPVYYIDMHGSLGVAHMAATPLAVIVPHFVAFDRKYRYALMALQEDSTARKLFFDAWAGLVCDDPAIASKICDRLHALFEKAVGYMGTSYGRVDDRLRTTRDFVDTTNRSAISLVVEPTFLQEMMKRAETPWAEVMAHVPVHPELVFVPKYALLESGRMAFMVLICGAPEFSRTLAKTWAGCCSNVLVAELEARIFGVVQKMALVTKGSSERDAAKPTTVVAMPAPLYRLQDNQIVPAASPATKYVHKPLHVAIEPSDVAPPAPKPRSDALPTVPLNLPKPKFLAFTPPVLPASTKEIPNALVAPFTPPVTDDDDDDSTDVSKSYILLAGRFALFDRRQIWSWECPCGEEISTKTQSKNSISRHVATHVHQCRDVWNLEKRFQSERRTLNWIMCVYEKFEGAVSAAHVCHYGMCPKRIGADELCTWTHETYGWATFFCKDHTKKRQGCCVNCMRMEKKGGVFHAVKWKNDTLTFCDNCINLRSTQAQLESVHVHESPNHLPDAKRVKQ